MGKIKKLFLGLAMLSAPLVVSSQADATMKILGFTGRQYSMPSGMFLSYLTAWSDEHIAQASIVLPCNANPTGCVLTLTTPTFQNGDYSVYVFHGTSDLAVGEVIHGSIVGGTIESSAVKDVSCKALGSGIYCY